MQASNTNKNTPNDPFYDFINSWSLPIGFVSLVIGLVSGTPSFTYIGLTLMFTYLLFGDISD